VLVDVPIQHIEVVWYVDQSRSGFLLLEFYSQWTGVVRDGALPP
jgi:hypothetical protein